MPSGINVSDLATYTDAELVTIYRWGLANGAAGTTRTINGRSITFPSAKDMLDILERLEERAADPADNVVLVQYGERR